MRLCLSIVEPLKGARVRDESCGIVNRIMRTSVRTGQKLTMFPPKRISTLLYSRLCIKILVTFST